MRVDVFGGRSLTMPQGSRYLKIDSSAVDLNRSEKVTESVNAVKLEVISQKPFQGQGLILSKQEQTIPQQSKLQNTRL
jgi:hypothetical protein